MQNFLTWLPRIIAIVYIGFISLFALDAFNGESPLGKQIIGFLIHLIPTFILIACLILAWKYRVLGGFFFLIFGMIFTIYFGTYKNPSNFLLISGPIILVGILFILSKMGITE